MKKINKRRWTLAGLCTLVAALATGCAGSQRKAEGPTNLDRRGWHLTAQGFSPFLFGMKPSDSVITNFCKATGKSDEMSCSAVMETGFLTEFRLNVVASFSDGRLSALRIEFPYGTQGRNNAIVGAELMVKSAPSTREERAQGNLFHALLGVWRNDQHPAGAPITTADTRLSDDPERLTGMLDEMFNASARTGVFLYKIEGLASSHLEVRADSTVLYHNPLK